jgi:hypothetical protein
MIMISEVVLTNITLYYLYALCWITLISAYLLSIKRDKLGTYKYVKSALISYVGTLVLVLPNIISSTYVYVLIIITMISLLYEYSRGSSTYSEVSKILFFGVLISAIVLLF